MEAVFESKTKRVNLSSKLRYATTHNWDIRIGKNLKIPDYNVMADKCTLPRKQKDTISVEFYELEHYEIFKTFRNIMQKKIVLIKDFTIYFSTMDREAEVMKYILRDARVSDVILMKDLSSNVEQQKTRVDFKVDGFTID